MVIRLTTQKIVRDLHSSLSDKNLLYFGIGGFYVFGAQLEVGKVIEFARVATEANNGSEDQFAALDDDWCGTGFSLVLATRSYST